MTKPPKIQQVNCELLLQPIQSHSTPANPSEIPYELPIESWASGPQDASPHSAHSASGDERSPERSEKSKRGGAPGFHRDWDFVGISWGLMGCDRDLGI